MKILINPLNLAERSYSTMAQMVRDYALPLAQTKFMHTGKDYDKNYDEEGKPIQMGPRSEPGKDSLHIIVEHTWTGSVAEVSLNKKLGFVFGQAKGYHEGSMRFLAADFSGYLMSQRIPYSVEYQ